MDNLHGSERTQGEKWPGKSELVRTAVISSAATSLVLFLVVFSFIYSEREAVGRYLLATPAAIDASPLVAEESAVISTVEEANPAVVSIAVTRTIPEGGRFEQFGPFRVLIPGGMSEREIEVGGGSGFIVSADGLVLTNKHVVDDPEAKYTVVTNSGEEYGAVIRAIDPYFDIAFLEIRGGGNFPHLEFGDSDELKLGQTVIAIGNALSEFRNSVSVGVVSGLSRSIIAGGVRSSPELLEEVIQTDAAINPGNSGGPLLDAKGKVIGVNVAVATESENIGFAIPGNIAKTALESVAERGIIVRPYLGVRSIAITPELKEERELPVSYGALITRGENVNDAAVVPGSPAQKAGIREGDILLEINGQKITEEISLTQLIRNKNVGERISVKFLRNGQEQELYVTLEKAPESS